MSDAEQIALRLAEAVMFLPGPLTKHHDTRLLIQRNDVANMLLGSGLREALEAGDRIQKKCEQYWNEPVIGIVKMHSILDFIHREQTAALTALKGEKDTTIT